MLDEYSRVPNSSIEPSRALLELQKSSLSIFEYWKNVLDRAEYSSNRVLEQPLVHIN